MIIVSACLLGVRCRFDGGSTIQDDLLGLLDEGEILIPLCPEQLGGLSTPRPPAQIRGGDGNDLLSGRARVINSEGRDVTGNFIAGAENTLLIARTLKIDKAVLKEKSPSCGVHLIKRGDIAVSGQVVASALLRRHGITVISSERVYEDYLRHYRHRK